MGIYKKWQTVKELTASVIRTGAWENRGGVWLNLGTLCVYVEAT